VALGGLDFQFAGLEFAERDFGTVVMILFGLFLLLRGSGGGCRMGMAVVLSGGGFLLAAADQQGRTGRRRVSSGVSFSFSLYVVVCWFGLGIRVLGGHAV
jgi:hypothetical protein